ncbi:MAG: hypothetical protein E7564_03560 [Ruminococcaceae bacterium]|nr:hypothetical protein [Oscillospiraceae bacterium]
MTAQLNLYGDGIHDDTAALQELIDCSGGDVFIPGGTYLISDTLFIHSNTSLKLAHTAIIRLADDACCIMLANDKWMRPGRNKNIVVEGGTWDGNNEHQRRGKVFENKPYFCGTVMRFEGIEDLYIHNVTFKDPEAYACQILDADRFTVENINFDFNMYRPNMDGIHIQGPARNGYVRNIKGATNDDLVALNCDDSYHDWNNTYITQGDIENITVDGLYADNGYTGVRLLSCGSKLRNVTIRNIFGTYRLFGVSFTHHNIIPGAPVWFDNINIDGIYCSKQPQDPPVDRRFIDGLDKFYGEGCHDWQIRHADIIYFESGVQCGNVTLSNIFRYEKAVTEAYTIHLTPDSSVRRLVINNVTQQFVNCPEQPLFMNEGTVENLLVTAGG